MTLMTFQFDDPDLRELKITSYAGITGHSLKLNKVQYSMRDLGFLIENASMCLRAILYTQKLTPEFCVKYINTDYSSGDSDDFISITEILAHQKHLTESQLIQAGYK